MIPFDAIFVFLRSQKQLPELRNHRQRAHTGFGLGGIEGYCDGLSVFLDLRDGVVDGDGVSFKIDGFPPQSQHLFPPQAIEGGQLDRHLCKLLLSFCKSSFPFI